MVLTHGKEKCLPASKETLTVQERSLEKAPLRKQLYEEVRGIYVVHAKALRQKEPPLGMEKDAESDG